MKEKFKKHPYLYSIFAFFLLVITAGFLWISHLNSSTGKELENELAKIQKRGMPLNQKELQSGNDLQPEQNAAPYYDEAISLVNAQQMEFAMENRIAEEQKETDKAQRRNWQKKQKGLSGLEEIVYPDYLTNYRRHKKENSQILKENERVFELIEKGNAYPYYKSKTSQKHHFPNYLKTQYGSRDVLRTLALLYRIKSYSEIDAKQYDQAQQTICQCLEFARNYGKNTCGNALSAHELSGLTILRNLMMQNTEVLLTEAGPKYKANKLKKEIALLLKQADPELRYAVKTEFAVALGEGFQVSEKIENTSKLAGTVIVPYKYFLMYRPQCYENRDKLEYIELTNIILDYLDKNIEKEVMYEKTHEILAVHKTSWDMNVTFFAFPNYNFESVEIMKDQWQTMDERIAP